MTKTQAVEMFGGVLNLARAIGVKHPSVSEWPEELTDKQTDRVIAAACLLDIEIPAEIKKDQVQRRSGWDKRIRK